VIPASPVSQISCARTAGVRLLLTALLLLSSACATRPPVPESAPESVWLAHRDRVETLSAWQVQGRVAIRRDDDGWNAAFDWLQQGASYRLRLRGPFGQGAVELHGDDNGVWLQRQDQPPVYARSVDRLLQEETGWQLPVLGLQDWLRGIPVNDQPAVLGWDRQGLLQSLQQDGWRIDYQRYRGVAGQQLPDRLKLLRDTLQVKVVVDDWQLP